MGVEEGLDSDGRRKPGRALWRRAGKWDGWMENETKGSEAGMGQRGGRGGKERKEEGVGRKGAGRAGGGGGGAGEKEEEMRSEKYWAIEQAGYRGVQGRSGVGRPIGRVLFSHASCFSLACLAGAPFQECGQHRARRFSEETKAQAGQGRTLSVPAAAAAPTMRTTPVTPFRHSGHVRPAAGSIHSRSAQPAHNPPCPHSRSTCHRPAATRRRR